MLLTVEESKFLFELGRFIENAEIEGLNTVDIQESVHTFLDHRKADTYSDDVVNYLFQAVQCQNGFIRGIYSHLDLEVQEQADTVLQEVYELATAAEKDFGFVTLTKVKEEN